jgi:mono/diheme cytochrome c family protein
LRAVHNASRPIMKSTAICIIAVLLLSSVGLARAADSGLDTGKLFDKNCATCHGKDGRAKTFRAAFNKARDLTDPQWQDTIADAAIIASISAGRDKMPAFATKLSEPQIAALAQYVRSLKH